MISLVLEGEINLIGGYKNDYSTSQKTYADWQRMGFSKGTLHYMKKNAETGKPFNFVLVAFQVIVEGKMVKPLAPYSKDPQTIVHQPFIDYETGEVKQGSHYFKSLSRTIMEYIDHPESKYEGDVGSLKRRDILADEIIHIGNEANNIDEQPLKTIEAQVFWNKQSICQKVLLISQSDAEIIGVR